MPQRDSWSGGGIATKKAGHNAWMPLTTHSAEYNFYDSDEAELRRLSSPLSIISRSVILVRSGSSRYIDGIDASSKSPEKHSTSRAMVWSFRPRASVQVLIEAPAFHPLLHHPNPAGPGSK